MTDPIAAFMQANGLAQPAFAPDSRYHGLPTAQTQLAELRSRGLTDSHPDVVSTTKQVAILARQAAAALPRPRPTG